MTVWSDVTPLPSTSGATCRRGRRRSWRFPRPGVRPARGLVRRGSRRSSGNRPHQHPVVDPDQVGGRPPRPPGGSAPRSPGRAAEDRRRGDHGASSTSAQPVLRWSRPGGGSTMRAAGRGRGQRAEAPGPASSVRADRPTRISSGRTRMSPPSTKPSSTSATWRNGGCRDGGERSGLGERLGAPGRSRIAPSARTKAGSSDENRIGMVRREAAGFRPRPRPHSSAAT